MSEPICPTCRAPIASRLAITDQIVWRFDEQRFLREKIAALTDEQIARCDAIGRSAEMHTESRPEYYNSFREALSLMLSVRGAALPPESQ